MTRLSPPAPSLLGRLFAVAAGLVLLVLGFMFSVVLIAVLAVGGLVAWAYFWWKTRALRRAMRATGPLDDGAVIDGEVVVVEDGELVRIAHTEVRREPPPPDTPPGTPPNSPPNSPPDSPQPPSA